MRLFAAALAGRTEETAVLAAAVTDACDGVPRTVLVHGEPGVGKTRLVADVCSRLRADGTSVLWGQCVHFGATSAPYLPLVSALEDSLTRSSSPSPSVFAALQALTGDGGGQPATRLVRLVENALGEICRAGPAVLVVDDLQWADVSTLDLLAYTLTVATPRRLAVLITYRDTELADGHVLHGWLGDVRRLPGVSDLPLHRLDRHGTEAQVESAMGATPRMTLVDEVWHRSGGNPYLTELLLQGVSPDASTLPAGVPDDLRAALLASWHRLRLQAREVTRLLAVAGRPVDPDDLRDVAFTAGLPADVPGPLAEAEAAGLVVTERSGTAWFHHPLLPEVLYGTLTTPETSRLHAAFVVAWEGSARAEEHLAGHLALHCERAGLPDRAFGYALQAAAHAAEVRAYPEETDQRHRAACLYRHVSADSRKAAPSETQLWCEVAQTASRVGRDDLAADAADAAVACMDAQLDPASSARALQLQGSLRFMAGRTTDQPLDSDREAVRLAARSGDLELQAVCLSSLSESETWSSDLDQARLHAQNAVDVAERSGSARARAWAFAARSSAHWSTTQSLDDADVALLAAQESGDAGAISHASLTRANALESLHEFEERAEEFLRGFALASEHGFGRWHQQFASFAANALMDVGRYDDARRLMVEALAVPSTGTRGLSARLNAVRLETYVGDLDAAARHLARAWELAPDLGSRAPEVLATYHLAKGEPLRALEYVTRPLFPQAGADLGAADWMVLHAAMASSELASASLDVDELAHGREAVRRLIDERNALGGTIFGADDRIAHAHRTVLEAELAGAFGNDDELNLWSRLGDVEGSYGEPWVMTVAHLHWARALMSKGRDRREVVVPLQRAHSRACELGFQAVRLQAEDLARQTRVRLDSVDLPTQRAGTSSVDGVLLTRREREVLGLLAEGRTYADIAEALFISQKTVSVHVTHVLQKTGTSSRAEASAWAWQHGMGSDA